MANHVTVTSFQKPRLEEMRAYAPELPAGWLVSEVSAATIAQARELGLTQICPRANAVTPALVRRLHAEGFVVRAWGSSTRFTGRLTSFLLYPLVGVDGRPGFYNYGVWVRREGPAEPVLPSRPVGPRR
jgi:Glycerophosphoryl diester phosphodiesterase family